MIKANELRIGNWLLNEYKEPVQVAPIFYNIPFLIIAAISIYYAVLGIKELISLSKKK